ncbi:putative bifunctional diguanylate cyclase/phosphodiesterase [Planococcus plakortidis]|uniref:putative bifunctional diguanylate cyclase/phosphodiesterase n=1 Tax=Planococcus plakortidis TaxID=1038856 RepID=UPI00385C4C38
MDDMCFTDDAQQEKAGSYGFPAALQGRVFEKMAEGMMVTSLTGEILFVNPAFELVTGYEKTQVLGKTPKILQSGKHDSAFYETMWQAIRKDGEWQGEIWNRRKNGDLYPEWLMITGVPGNDGEVSHYCGIFTDLTEGKAAAREMKELALSDPLTGVSNRYDFAERMDHLIKTAASYGFRHSLLFMDLDRFRQVNESLGHRAGDRLLVEVAGRIRKKLRSKDLLARYGGDEFVIAMSALKHPKEAAQLAEELVDELEQPFQFEGQEVRISTSIGISLYPDDGKSGEELLQKAGHALRSAKQFGSGQFSFFHGDSHDTAKRTLILENELRRAIEYKQMRVHYQPKIALRDGSFAGMEALVRWNSDRLGPVSPGEFIPLAETTGLIIPLSEQIIELACADFLKYDFATLSPAKISLNISAFHFKHPALYEGLLSIFERMNCSPSHFELELTEGAVMGEGKAIEDLLARLREAGFGLSIDDFGTGYSSLSYLQRFQVDWLKIDRSFVHGIAGKKQNRHIVEAIIKMAHSLQMKVVAEGAETHKEVEILAGLGCDRVQGYVFAKPMPPEEIQGYIEELAIVDKGRKLL